MNEKLITEQILRLINANYCDFYAIDILSDKVLSFVFNEDNKLVKKSETTYTDFIDQETKMIKPEEVEAYFNALSLNKLEELFTAGVSESKVKYRRLLETGEYRWFQNIINYLPIENNKIIFMMSEDVHERLTDTEQQALNLEKKAAEYETALEEERASIGDAILRVNNTLAAQGNNSSNLNNTREFINSVFNKVAVNNPELNKVLSTKIGQTSNSLKKYILIIDDSSVIRNSLKRIFDDTYEIVMAKNGEEGIDIIDKNIVQQNFDPNRLNIVGILLDLIMPGKTGFDVLNYLKQRRLLDKIPVAIISGDETIETRKKVYEYDIVDMLEKPFNIDNIKKRINKIISLYETGNSLQSLLTAQEKKIEEQEASAQSNTPEIIVCNVVKNIHNCEISQKITNYCLALATELKTSNPALNIDDRFIKAITDTCYLYNIGSIAMDNTAVINKEYVETEINYALEIIKIVLTDEYDLKVASNIVKYACETYNGRGLPNGIQGVDIPIEAAIVAVAVRLANDNSNLPFASKALDVIEDESPRYNPNVLAALNAIKDRMN